MHKKNSILLFILLCLLIQCPKTQVKTPSFVTYEFSGGRFGDNLLAYIHAKWIAYAYHLPLLYKPFTYSDHLVLHEKELPFHPKQSFAKTIPFPKKDNKIDATSENVLYSIRYFPDFDYEFQSMKKGGSKIARFPISWHDQSFKTLIREMIQPNSAIERLEIPTNILTLAIHIRKGGDFENFTGEGDHALKAPPTQFYIDAIRQISTMTNGVPIYAYIFTDDPEPKKFADLFTEIFAKDSITFDYRKENNSHSSNVLEDFFSMQQFDCLIRPDSNYSYIASKLQDYRIVISPKNVILKNNNPFIDQFTVEE